MSHAFLRVGDIHSLVNLAGELGTSSEALPVRTKWALDLLCRLTDSRVGMAIPIVTDEEGRPLRFAGDYGQFVGLDDTDHNFIRCDFCNGQPIQPMRDAFMGTAPGIVTLSRQQAVSDRVWYRSDYFHQVMKPVHCDQAIVSRIHRPGRGMDIGVAVCRDPGEEPFGERERQIVDVFQAQITPLLFHPRFTATPQTQPQGLPDVAQLPERCQPVLTLLLRGLSAKEIAQRTRLSQHTVREYIKIIYGRLGVSSKGELLARYIR